jgi:hypothetical protein
MFLTGEPTKISLVKSVYKLLRFPPVITLNQPFNLDGYAFQVFEYYQHNHSACMDYAFGFEYH